MARQKRASASYTFRSSGVRAAAILQLIEEEGVTPEMIEKWGEYDEKDGVMYLVFEVEDITEGVNGSEFFKRRDILDYCIALSEL